MIIPPPSLLVHKRHFSSVIVIQCTFRTLLKQFRQMTIHSFSQTFNVCLVLTVFRWSLEVVTKYVSVRPQTETQFCPSYQIYFIIFKTRKEKRMHSSYKNIYILRETVQFYATFDSTLFFCCQAGSKH